MKEENSYYRTFSDKNFPYKVDIERHSMKPKIRMIYQKKYRNYVMYPFIVITHFQLKPSTHYRINLSPFTKDFRVWGAPIETNTIYLRVTLG